MNARRSSTGVFVALMWVMLALSPNLAWALTITPNPPIAGQPFNITGYGPGAVFVFTGSGCGGELVFLSGPLRGGAYNVTVSGLPAGHYHLTVPENIGCVNFTVIPATATVPQT